MEAGLTSDDVDDDEGHESGESHEGNENGGGHEGSENDGGPEVWTCNDRAEMTWGVESPWECPTCGARWARK